jgi:transposase InsO family protein
MCKVIQVSRSGYYEWLNNPDCNRDKQDRKLAAMIKLVFREGRGNYGSRTIKKKLESKGELISRRRIIRLMRTENLICKTKRKFKATTDSNHNLSIAPNLLNRRFKVDQPNRCYVGDITYIATNEGWLYLATVIDLYSRKIVGWSMAENMKADLVNNALLMAIWQRKPDKGLIWHTDRGSQYASHSHCKIIRQHGIIQSMSRKGNCWDNAVAESFFHTLKNELIYQTKFKTRQYEEVDYISSFLKKISFLECLK